MSPIYIKTPYEQLDELTIQYSIELDDNGVPIDPISDQENFVWSISAVDPDTLEVIAGEPNFVLSAVNYRFSKAQGPVMILDSLADPSITDKIFEVQLRPPITPIMGTYQPELYLPIIPYVSGGSLFSISMTGQNILNRTLSLANAQERYEGNAFLRGDGITSLSGILTGSVWDVVTESSKVSAISGVIDYFSGNLRIDFSQLPNDTFITGFSGVSASFEGNYLTPYNEQVAYVSAAQLQLTLTANDTDSILVSCGGWDSKIPYSSVFHPYRIAILEDQYKYTSSTVSAVYQSRDRYYDLSPYLFYLNQWPYDMLSGRAIVWKSEEANSHMISGYFPKQVGGTPSAFPISGWSNILDEMEIRATGPDDVFQVSACFPDDTLGRRTTAVYEFTYRIPTSEVLTINTETFTITSEVLKVYNTITTISGTFVFDPISPLTWESVNGFPNTNLTASSGVAFNDYSLETYLVSNYLPIAGDVGLTEVVSLCSYTGITTAYDHVYGVDYLNVKYDPDPDIVYTYSVAYTETPTLSTTHTFQVYSPPSALFVSAIGFDNLPFTRRLTAKAYNIRGEEYLPLHPANKIRWNITSPVAGAASMEDIDGNPYIAEELANDTMVFNLTTTSFDLITIFPTLCTFHVQASAYDTYNAPYNTFLSAATGDFTIDTFPSSGLFRSSLQLNYENTGLITDMWRVSADPYILSATEVTFVSSSEPLEYRGPCEIDFGEGLFPRQVSAISPASGFYYGLTGIFNVSFKCRETKAVEWLSSHAIHSDVNLHLVTQYISADFRAYPTHVFLTSTVQAVNTFVDPISTLGVYSYDVGHTEPFLLQAWDPSITNYNWEVGTEALPDNTPNATHNVSQITSGLPVTLEVYNNEMSNPMPPTYIDDDAGIVVNYPNKKTTDNATLCTEHIRVIDYESADVTIIPQFSDLLFIYNVPTAIVATQVVILPVGTPVVETGGTMYWVLSTPNWIITEYANIFNHDITMALEDVNTGNVTYNTSFPMILYATRKSHLRIPNTFPPNDWDMTLSESTTSYNISYTVMPELLFYTLENYVKIGETVTFRNGTSQVSSICAFHFFDGYGTTAYYVSPTAYNDFTTSYPIEGTFNLSVTAVFFNNETFSMVLNNAVNVISAFEPFDEDITRIFGETVITFPNSYDQTIIPPNEWATSTNFNRSMNRLNENLEYLKDMTKFYTLPPTDYFGWLGSAITYNQTTFKWHYTNIEGFQDLDESLTGEEFTSVMDMVVDSDYIYVADESTIKIYTNSILPTKLNTISKKTFDDELGTIKSIAVDSKNKIYALDTGKNRVVVFDSYNVNHPNSNVFLYEWGGLGGPNAKTKFQNPNELILDKDENIWVTDMGNKVVKQYTNTGSWLQTIDVSDYVTGTTPETGGIISTNIDSNLDIHVLTRTTVFKFSINGTYITSYKVPTSNNNTARKIIPMYNSGFLYICFDNSVEKVLENGNYVGTFANSVFGAEYTSIYQDTSYNVYIANTNSILKYFDMIEITQSRALAVDKYFWNISDITLDKDEYIQDWVCNLVFKRMWDNIELFRRDLIGHIIYTTDSNGFKNILIRDYTPAEYNDLVLTHKDDMFVGINELCTNDVLNRCITLLYENLEVIRKNV